MPFFRKRQPTSRILLHKKNFYHNLSFFQTSVAGRDIFPVLKSNAYGHGLLPIIKLLNKHDAPYIVIDSILEYNTLKNKTSKKFIMIGETLPQNYPLLNRKRITPCVGSLPVLKALIATNKARTIHLFINTGMNREGFSLPQLTGVLNLIKKSKLTVEGVCSHFSCADQPQTDSLDTQISAFKTMHWHIINAWHNPRYRHIGNSAGTLKMQDDFFTAYRVGIGLFGFVDFQTDDEIYTHSTNLKPVLELRSRLLTIQDIGPNQWVSYNKTRTSTQAARVWLVPLGYNEWIPRSLSNKLIAQHIPSTNSIHQRGNICMNIMSFEIDQDAQYGDEICLINPDRKAPNSIINLAHTAETIPYELLVWLDHHIRREIV